MDFKAKYSQISSGAINFNASLALVDAAAFLNTPSFYPNPNDQKFVYINNIKPKNEQENLNLSLRGDWDLSFATLSGYVAYNDQQNYFLTDGTSAAFQLYGLNPTCQASNDALSGVQPLPSPFFYVPSSIWYQPGPGQLGSFLPPYSPTTCDGYQYQERNQSDTSIEVRLTSPGDEALRWVGGLYYAYIDRDVVVSQGSDLNQGLLGQGVRAHERQEPDRPALRRHVQHQRLFDLRPAGLRRGRERRARARAALRQRAARREQQREDLQREHAHRVPRADAAASTSAPTRTSTPPTRRRPSYATNGIPDRSKTFSELQPKLSANWAVQRRGLALRLLRLRVPQRRIQLVGQRGDDQPVLRQPVLCARRAEHLGREGRLQERDLRGRRDRHEVDPARPAPAGEPRRVLHPGRRPAVLQLLRRPVRPAARRDQHRRGDHPGRRGRLPLERHRQREPLRRLFVHRQQDRPVQRPAVHRRATRCRTRRTTRATSASSGSTR